MDKKVYPEIALGILAVVLFSILLTAQNPQTQETRNGKTVIIFIDALRWDFVLDNLDELENFKYIVDNGVYGKLKPVSPTFTVAQHPAIYSSKRSDKVDWYYAFTFNSSREWDCSKAFVGERPSPDTGTNILKIFSQQGKRVVYLKIAEGKVLGSAEMQNALEIGDVISIYDPNPDHFGHITNLTEKRNALFYMKMSDSSLGTVLAALRSQGIIERTNIIVFGDHGMAHIEKFPKTSLIIQDLKSMGMNDNNTCYWNDAGVSLRFWFRNESVRQQLEPKIKDYFRNNVPDRECFFVPDEEYLRAHHVLHPDPVKKRESLGDLIIGLKVGCKLLYEGTVPSFLKEFGQKLNEVDAYVSMHGYLDNDHEETIAFIGMVGPVFKKNFYADMSILDVTPTFLCSLGYKNENYYTSVDGKVRCDVVKECKC